MSIINLVTKQNEISAEAIEMLESALERAKRGEVVAVAIATTNLDGSFTTGHSRSEFIAPLIGALSVLHARLVRQCIE